MAIHSPAKVALFREILGKLERSKSPLLVTISRRKSYELALYPGGQGWCAERAAALEPKSTLACNRELLRIPLPRTSVNRGNMVRLRDTPYSASGL